MQSKAYIIASLLLLFSIHSFAQTSLPYYTSFETVTQQSDWTEFRNGATANSGYVFDNTLAYSGTSSLAHNYPVGGSSATNDWIVSPPFNFASGGKIDSIRHDFYGFGSPMAGDTVAIYLLVGNQNPTLASSKLLLMDYRGINYVNNGTWNIDTNIVIPPTIGQCYIAFRYTTIVNWLDVRFDNLHITSNEVAGINSVNRTTNDFVIYPNPTDNFISISNDISANAKIVISDISGKIFKMDMDNKNQIDIHDLQSGVYFLKITDGDVSIEKSFIKK
ncbi:MAG: hypothetical protein RJA07_914 [Bacteroidota bacterium]|jgi:hypothetical protein